MSKKKTTTKEPTCQCKHPIRYHANPEKHNLKTSHCTICECKNYEEEKQNE